MLEKKKFIIGGALIMIAVIFLIVLGLKSGATYYYEVNELFVQGSSLDGKTVRVGGEVTPDVEHEVGKLCFKIIDTVSQDTTLPVVYQGSVPDTFKVGRYVIVEGRYNPKGVFEATSIITKCPSKYQPEETLGN
ncbi:cytochrome c maturation protein CcmE [Chloroflexota bacterium]